MGLDGKEERVLPTGADAWVSAFTPDLSGYYAVRFDRPDHLLLRIVSKQRGTATAYEGSWKSGQVGDTPELTWGRADGSEAMILVKGAVLLWPGCGETSEALIDKDILAFAPSSTRLYFIRQSAPNVLGWKDWEGSSAGSLELPSRSNRIWIGRSPYEVVTGLRVDSFIGDLSVANTDGEGGARPISPPVAGTILDLVSVEGTGTLALKVWEGKRERIDGTEIATFFLWDYATNRVTRLIDDPGGYQIHVHSRDVFRKTIPRQPCANRR